MIHGRSRSARPLATIVALVAVASCLSNTSPTFPNPSISVSNITTSTCTHQQAGGVLCTIGLDVQLSHASAFDTLLTIVTNDSLSQTWVVTVIGENITYTFPKSKLTRTDTGCLRAQDSIYIYDGPSAAGYPLIAATKITPITLTCS